MSNENEEAYYGDWKDFVHTASSTIAWKIDGVVHIFEIVKDVDYPQDAKIVKDATFEDHLEQLLQDKSGKWYRHAGGGRGFYWTQLLELVKTEVR